MGDTEDQVNEVDKRLSIHEAVCAQRYDSIRESFDKGAKRMQKIEYLLYAIGAAVLMGPGFAATLLKKFIGI